MKIYNPTIEGEITLPAFPSTRNDGVIPTNKILSTDASGNLKLYSIATAPAPFLDYVVPDSTLPSTTGNFQLHGSFFTPSMCLTANLATSIIFTGQTVNYAVFHSSNWIEVNITTGATEGSFAITLNNGLSATFNNAILIVLGDVFTPTPTDWNTITEPIDLTQDGEVLVKTFASVGSAKLSFIGDITKKISFYTTLFRSPLGTVFPQESTTLFLTMTDTISGNSLRLVWENSGEACQARYSLNMDTFVVFGWTSTIINPKFRLYYDLTTFYLYGGVNGTTLYYTIPAGTFTNNVEVLFTVKRFDQKDVKYVEHF